MFINCPSLKFTGSDWIAETGVNSFQVGSRWPKALEGPDFRRMLQLALSGLSKA